MNREIDYITNVTTTVVLDTSGQWSYSSSLPPADECCIRQVTYSSSNAIKSIYQISSNIGMIGNVCAIPGFTSNPGTRIQLRTQPMNLTFQMLLWNGQSTTATATDFVSINMDFIKYRR